MFGQNNYGQPYGQQQYGQQYPSTPAPQVELSSMDELINSGGAKGFFDKNSPVGARVEGEVLSADIEQAHDFQTKQPEFWPNGKAKQQIHIVLQTSLQDDPDDDGRRSLWIKGWGVQLRALRDATKKANVKMPKVGDRMIAQYMGLGPQGNSPQPPKMFQYEIIPAAQAGMESLLNTPTAQPEAQSQFAAPTVNQAPTIQQSPVATPAQAAGPKVDTAAILQLVQIGRTPQDIANLMGLETSTVEKIIADSTGGQIF